MSAAANPHMPKVITFCYHWQRPGLKMCDENKNEACIIAHPSAQLPLSLSLYFLSVLMKTFFYYRVCEVIGHWTLSMTHLFLLTVRSVSLPQNSYTSHCGPCPLKALRHVSLSSGAKVSPTLLILLLPKLYKDQYSVSTSFWLQCPTEVPKVWVCSLLKPCNTSKCCGDFPPEQLCPFPCYTCSESSQWTQYTSGRDGEGVFPTPPFPAISSWMTTAVS